MTAKKPAEKKPAEKKVKAKPAKAAVKKPGKYIFAVGRRKTATASVRMFPSGNGAITVNGREFVHYFPTQQLQKKAAEPLSVMGLEKKISVEARVSGGGTSAQADAIRLGLARALVIDDPSRKTTLKKHDLMSRDSRKKERKKPGLKRARRGPQWAKR